MTGRGFAESVLVVDDTDFMVQVLSDLFAAEGFQVHSARSGPEALILYDRVLPDLVTLDLVMPGMDGLAVLAALREIDPAARVVMVSAVGQEERVMDAIRLGARNYVLKPIDREKVLETVRRVLDDY
ncbi:MAG: response regulator [Deltaproteobacteria bacterium]|nr:response regulator [Deltaproteobacteria bacterium]